jgi:hypothetical protein
MRKFSHRYHKRRAFSILPAILFATAILLASCTPQTSREGTIGHTKKSDLNTFLTHFTGGFGINTPERATKAAADGMQVVFKYGEPPSSGDPLGQTLNALHMKVIDTMPWTYLYRYECHRLKTLVSPSAFASYCNGDYPEMASENALFAALTAHLQQVQANQLIIGYWILDDWVREAGDGKQILINIHTLIQKYAPGQPTICGFGGGIGLNRDYEWDDWTAGNFSPQGCDMVAPYIYTSSIADGALSPDAFNWPMTGLLPAIFTSLRQRGWDIKKEPLIGIGQAFGGPFTDGNRYYAIPDARDIAIQSRSFCTSGATGLVFYTWDDLGFGPTSQNPMNSPEIETGIRNGIAACKKIWHS